MLQVETILGSSADTAFAETIHHLCHHGHIEYVTLSEDDLDRRRLLASTDAGREVAIALPRHEKLFDGAVLHCDDHLAVIVRAGEQRWLRFTPAGASDALQLGYHAGNLHWRVRFEGSDLLVAQNGPAQGYIDRLQPMIAAGQVIAQEQTP